MMQFAVFEDLLNPDQPTSYWFSHPVHEICIHEPTQLNAGLNLVDEYRRAGYYIAGYVAYDAWWALLSPTSLARHSPQQPLLYAVAFRRAQQFAASKFENMLTQQEGVRSPTSEQLDITYLELEHDQSSYQQLFAQVQKHLVAGDSYQLNLTLRAQLHFNHNDSLAVYCHLRQSNPVRHAAYLPAREQAIISLSPELFFSKQGQQLLVRPMKGTAARGATPAQDVLQQQWLAQDSKNRAENLIIVDLLRNDLAKICHTASVTPRQLFKVEAYPTLLQMVSEIEGNCERELSFATIIQALFPCGSISGAPKLRTLQLIDEIESSARGVYSGAIGYILPNNDMQFNVAIRSVVYRQSQGQASAGVGGGITIQATPIQEWQEIMTKLAFLSRSYQPQFNLVEAFLYRDGQVQHLLPHLKRLRSSAERLLFACPSLEQLCAQIDQYLNDHLAGTQERFKLRLELNVNGKILIEHQPLGRVAPKLVIAVLTSQPLAYHPLFQHKTTAAATRGLYQQLYQRYLPAGVDELVFINQDGIVTEAGYYNLIIDYAGQWLTSPVSAGLLPGVFRSQLLNSGQVVECPLTLAMLKQATAIYLCNDVRGLIKCQLHSQDC